MEKKLYSFGISGILYLILNICVDSMNSQKKDIGFGTIIFILVAIPILQIDFFSEYFFCLLLIPLIRVVIFLFSFLKKIDAPELLIPLFFKYKTTTKIVVVLDFICVFLCLLIFGHILNVPNMGIKITKVSSIFFATSIILFVFLYLLKNKIDKTRFENAK